MAVRSLVVVWFATCAFGLPAYVNNDCGKRVLAPSPDTSGCAGAYRHGREIRDRRLVRRTRQAREQIARQVVTAAYHHPLFEVLPSVDDDSAIDSPCPFADKQSFTCAFAEIAALYTVQLRES